MAPNKKNQGAKPKRKGFTLAALPGHSFNPTAGLDSPEKEISGSIDEEDDQEDVGSFNNDNTPFPTNETAYFYHNLCCRQ